MFFAFFSREDHRIENWPAIWDVEVAVQAILMEQEEFSQWTELHPADICLIVKERIREYGLLCRILSDGVTEEWLDSLLKREGPSLLAFIDQISKMPVAQVAAALRPSEERLLDCISKSSAFRAHISIRSSKGKEQGIMDNEDCGQ